MLRSNAKFVPGTSQNRQRISRHFDKTWRDAANDFGGSNPGELAAWVRFPAARVKDAHAYSGPGAHHRISPLPLPTPSSWGEGNISGALMVAISRSARVNSPVLTAVWKLCMVHCRNHVPGIRPSGMRSLAPNL